MEDQSSSSNSSFSSEDIEGDSNDDHGAKLYIRICEGENIVPISQVVKHLDHSEIQLTSYGVGLRALRPLVAVLQVNQCVTSLKLGNNGLSDAAVALLADGLRCNPRILELDLSMNQFGAAGAISLGEVLLSKESNLATLNISNNRIPDKAGAVVVETIENNTTLTDLDLSHNQLGDRTSQALLNTLQVNNTLKRLDVSWNPFRSRGVIAIAEGLKPNLSVQSIDLAWVGMKDPGAEAIGAMLHLNQGLAEIIASGNGVTETGARHIANGIHANDTLASIALDQNNLQDAGGNALKEAIAENPGFVSCRIDSTNMSSGVRMQLELVLEERTTSHKLSRT